VLRDFWRLSRSVHAFLASSGAAISMVQLEDLTSEVSQTNLPATSKEHPNWRRRLSKSLEDLREDPAIATVIDTPAPTARSPETLQRMRMKMNEPLSPPPIKGARQTSDLAQHQKGWVVARKNTPIIELLERARAKRPKSGGVHHRLC
jgi:hypothetical protein